MTRNLWKLYLPSNVDVLTMGRGCWKQWSIETVYVKQTTKKIWGKYNGCVWNYLKVIRFNKAPYDPQAISLAVEKVSELLYLKNEAAPTRIGLSINLPASRWKPPNEGYWKMNVDVTWLENTQSGGTDWIICWNDRPIGSGCILISTSWSVKVLEAKVIKDGLKHSLASWDGQNPRWRLNQNHHVF